MKKTFAGDMTSQWCWVEGEGQWRSLEGSSDDAVALGLGRSVVAADFAFVFVLELRFVFRVLVHRSQVVQLQPEVTRTSLYSNDYVTWRHACWPVVPILWLAAWIQPTWLIRRGVVLWGNLHMSSSSACRLQTINKRHAWRHTLK